MKKVIGIINNNIPVNDFDNVNKSRGGSETWLFQFSAELAKNDNYHVIVFTNGPEDWNIPYYSIQRVEFVPMSQFDHRIQYQKFDRIIISRIYEGIVTKIEESGCCDNIVIQSHDWGLGYWYPNEYRYASYDDQVELHSTLVKKVIALSEWHIESIKRWTNLPEELMTIIPNGIDLELFNDIDLDGPRDSHILWSSRPERGCDIATDFIGPTVRQAMPEFMVEIASYDPIQDRFKDRNDLIILGSLDKKDLYKEMAKHKVWFYTSTYPETFNITLPEAILCGCMPVLPLQHGMATTLKPFLPFGMSTKFYDQYWVQDGVWDEAIIEAANMILDYINNYESNTYRKLRDSMQQWIRSNYTWSRVVELYEKLWKELGV